MRGGHASGYGRGAGSACSSAEFRQSGYVQVGVAGVGVGMPLGQFDELAEKTAPNQPLEGQRSGFAQ